MSTQKSNTVVAVAAIFIAVLIIVFAIVKGTSTPLASPGEENTSEPQQTHNQTPTVSNNDQNEPETTPNQDIARIDQSTSLTTPSMATSDKDDSTSSRAVVGSPATPDSAAPDNPTGKGAKSPTLLEAASTGNIAQLQKLIESGADIDAHDQAGRTALMAAAGDGQLDAVFALLNAGANPPSETTAVGLHEIMHWLGTMIRSARRLPTFLKMPWAQHQSPAPTTNNGAG